jgi:hypothetical protein
MIRSILQITCFVLAVMLSGCQERQSSAPASGNKDGPVEKDVQIGTAAATGDKITSSSGSDENNITVVAYYFHPTIRCHTCLAIEADAERAIKNNFPQQITKESLIWMPFNLDDPGGKDFEKQFDISGSTLVIAKMQDGKVIEFKKLEKVWQLVGDNQAFSEYVKNEINEYMNGK